MFDPSKLDLDLENTGDENTNKKTTPEPKKEVIPKKIISEQTEKTENIETKDILDDLNVSEKVNKKEIITETITDNSDSKETELKKNIIKIDENKETIIDTPTENKIIFDINLTNIDILLAILVDKEYDFVTCEPTEEAVTITFRKDKVIKETRYIKYPTYTNILLKAKALTKLTIDEVENEQEGNGEKIIRNKNFKISSKVVPSDLGSKLFLKTTKIEKKIEKKTSKKTSFSQILGFLGAISFIALIIGGGFIGFIVLNAKTIEDVKFFYSLGINLNDINNFIGQAISIIFSILLFIETIFLIMFLFKFSLTKKEFKQKKIRYGILSALILIFTFSTSSAWMIIDSKIKALPNWQEMAYGDVQIYDNAKLLSDSFDKQGSLLQDTSNLIGPVQIKFDITFLANKEKEKGIKIKKYIWDFGDGEIKETIIPNIIYNFNNRGNYEIKLTIQGVDIQGKIIDKEVANIPNVNIGYIVDINETKLNNGGKIVDFDATELKELGKIEWYFIDDLEKPVWTGDIFRMGKPIFEETLIGMYIKRNDKKSTQLDKLFIIKGEEEFNLDGEITYTRGLIDDLEYELQVEKLKNDFGNGYIKEFKWQIGDKEITKQGDIIESTKSSKITFNFKSYGEHTVSVTIKDSAGETKTLTTIIDIPKKLKLSKNLRIYNNGTYLDNINYESELNEYYINEIGIPTQLKLDARFIKSNNTLYTLKKVDWDYNSDGDIDESSKTGKYDINTEGNHIITVYYQFAHRKLKDDFIKVKEQIFIEGIKKDAIINFKITKKSDYVPVIVGFDASNSQVKNENIEKFIWDYGDGFTEERDSIVPGHKYTTPGDYEIKLTVVTTSGKEYSSSKKLILKPKPQSVKISASMKNAPILQGIDFESEKSEGQIIGYFWSFGDGEISTEANPSHSYKKAGTYKVNLKLDFANKNILEDNITIDIYE